MQDLDQATFASSRGRMRLLHCDILLERCACLLRWAPKFSSKEAHAAYMKAQKNCDEATQEIESVGYKRRTGWLKALQTQLNVHRVDGLELE
jgi:hypothetical protein